jgi:hypothetical protein
MKKVIAYSGTQIHGTTSTLDIWLVPAGQNFKIEEMQVIFGSGVDFDLEIALYHGPKQVIPEVNTIVGLSGRIPIKCEWTWGSGENIKLYVKNNSTTNDYKYSVILIGELE